MRKNPITVVGRLERCWLFTYSTPEEEALRLLPPALEPVTHGSRAFWNIVVSFIRDMRPPLVPALLGVSYWHVAYRFYVRFRPEVGEPIEGLYFVRSDCSSRVMTFFGNLLTDFRFHTAPVVAVETGPELLLRIVSPDAPAEAVVRRDLPAQLPPDSAFDSLEEAFRFLKYKPYGISPHGERDANVVAITRREDAWQSRLVPVERACWGFLEGRPVRPEVCYEVQPIEYRWNRGRIIPGRVEKD